MQRLLLLMTTHTYRATAFLEAARRLGVPVVVGSERPQALSAVNPAGYLTLDFLAPEAAAHTIVEYHQRYPIAAVVAADDDGVVLAATAAAALGLAHNPVEAVMAARNKHRMRQILAAAGVPGPRFWHFRFDHDPAEMARHVDYPCVLKPLSLSASRGVIRADDPSQFVTAFQRLTALFHRPEVMDAAHQVPHELLVEAFIPGREVALEGLLTDGTLRVLTIFDKPDPLDGPFFEETIYVTPSRFPTALQDAMAACVSDMAAALGLRHGLVHAELRLNEHGPWPLEIAPRSIGGLCSRTLRFGSGLSLEDLILRHAFGQDVRTLDREKQSTGVMMIPIPCAGILRQVDGVEVARQMPGIDDIRITIPIGHEVIPLPEGSKYLGFIFARDDTAAAVEAALREAHRRLSVVITPADEALGQAEHLSTVSPGADPLSLLE